MISADSDVSLTKLSVRLGAYRSHPNSDGAGPPPFIFPTRSPLREMSAAGHESAG